MDEKTTAVIARSTAAVTMVVDKEGCLQQLNNEYNCSIRQKDGAHGRMGISQLKYFSIYQTTLIF